MDYQTQDATAFSPRLALLYKRHDTTYKLMYGHTSPATPLLSNVLGAQP